MAYACLLLAILTGQDQPQNQPKYRYEVVAPVKPGTTLYAGRESGKRVPAGKDVFAYADVMKSVNAGDAEGLVELDAAGRLYYLEQGTELRVLQFRGKPFTEWPAYEVRFADGAHKDKKGWVYAAWARKRVLDTGETPTEKPSLKPKPKRKRR